MDIIYQGNTNKYFQMQTMHKINNVDIYMRTLDDT